MQINSHSIFLQVQTFFYKSKTFFRSKFIIWTSTVNGTMLISLLRRHTKDIVKFGYLKQQKNDRVNV